MQYSRLVLLSLSITENDCKQPVVDPFNPTPTLSIHTSIHLYLYVQHVYISTHIPPHLINLLLLLLLISLQKIWWMLKEFVVCVEMLVSLIRSSNVLTANIVSNTRTFSISSIYHDHTYCLYNVRLTLLVHFMSQFDFMFVVILASFFLLTASSLEAVQQETRKENETSMSLEYTAVQKTCPSLSLFVFIISILCVRNNFLYNYSSYHIHASLYV